MASPVTLNPMSPDELRLLNEAEQMLRLRENPGFQRYHHYLKVAVSAAREELEKNRDPRFDAHLARVYRERKSVLDFADRCHQAIIDQRRESIKEFFRDLGIPEELIARNEDISLDFMTRLEAPNEAVTPPATRR